MVFPSNQVKQFFVLKKKVANSAAVLADAAGTYCINTDADGAVSLTIKGAKGGITTTDFIDKKCLVKAAKKNASDLTTKLKVVNVKLNSAVNEGEPVVSQDYVLAIDFKLGAGYSDEDSYIKHAAVRVTSGMDAAKFYNKLAVSIFLNFKKVYSPLIEIANAASDGNVVAAVKEISGVLTAVDSEGSEVTFSNGVFLRAISQIDQWERGHKELQFVNFDVHFSTIKVDGMDEIWGTKTASLGASVGNGYMTADMEWYFMGDRADMYRDVYGAGKSINTQYMVDETKTYDFVEIQYFYSGPGTEDTGKSPKHLTLVAATTDSTTAKIEDIVSALA